MAIDYRLLNEDGNIDLEQWRFRHQAKTTVGRCRCGSSLSAGGTQPWEIDHRGTKHLQIVCEGCGRESGAPDGRLSHIRRVDPDAALVR